jgi:hypothetical protein
MVNSITSDFFIPFFPPFVNQDFQSNFSPLRIIGGCDIIRKKNPGVEKDTCPESGRGESLILVFSSHTPKTIATRAHYRGKIMRIKVRDEKITKAIKKLEGIEIVLKGVEDAKKALRLILRRTETSKTPDYAGLKDIAVSQVIESRTSAVENLIFYEIEFLLSDEKYTDMEIGLIKELQSMFEKL